MLRKKFNLSWTQALAEIALIFIGITLAVAFNNWNENRKDDKLRQGYYERLLTELEQDRTDLASITEYHQQRARGIWGFFHYLDSVPRPNADSLQTFIQDFSYHMNTYIPNGSTYDELVSTGNIKLIETEIRERLIRLASMHAYTVETQHGFETRYDDRRNQMAQVIDEASFYDIRKNPNPQLVRWQRDINSGGFRRYSNLLAVRLQIATTLVSIYGSVDQRCEELMELIKAQMD